MLHLVTLELFVIRAVCWVLRVLVRSSGPSGLLLGFFPDTLAQWLMVSTASSTPASWSIIVPAVLRHRVPLGLGAGAATTWQAALPPADWLRSHIGRLADPPPSS